MSLFDLAQNVRRCRRLADAYVVVLLSGSVIVGCGGDTMQGPAPGSINVVTILSGNGTDPNGLQISAGARTATVAPGDSIEITSVDPGSYNVSLGDFSTQCGLLGLGTQRVEVREDQTARVEFNVACFGKIAFISTRDHPRDVHYMDEAGVETNLTDSPEIDYIEDVSPDGSTILFVRDAFDLPEIYAVGIDGTSLTNLSNTPDAVERSPRWSPDGTRILFESDRDGARDVFVMNADGTGVVNLTQSTTRGREAEWSPDGSQIAFVADLGGGNQEVFVMDSDGTNHINVSDHSAPDTRPGWSPDGSLIVFESYRNNVQEPWVVAPDGTGLRRLFDGSAISYVWSPDGSKLLFVSSVGNFDIMSVNVDGTGLVNLTNNPGNDGGGMTWLPDGSWIIFSSNRTGRHLYAMRPDGTQQMQIAGGDDIEFLPQIVDR